MRETSEFVIFISYRRDDAAMASGRIDDFLCRYFDKKQIFRDMRQIGIGSRFPEKLQQALEQCRVLIIVIGQSWLTIADEYGRRRLDKEDDWVKKEIITSVRLRKSIIPILLEDAKMPTKNSLPEDLQPITDYQALRVRDETFVYDMLTLQKYLEKVENLPKNEENPDMNEIREIVLEEFFENLDFDKEEYHDLKESFKELLYEEIIEEYHNEMMADEDDWRR